MPTVYEDDQVYELGEAECPNCGYPVDGYFIEGVLVKTGICSMCAQGGEV